MDPDLAGIFMWVFALALLALSMAHVFHRRTVVHEERKLELKAQVEIAKASKGRRDDEAYAKLEERVRVLERIATDSNHALASQIDQLRDLNEIELQTKRESAR